VIRNQKGRLYRINGGADHLHLFCNLHPTICLADFVKNIKGLSWHWINDLGIFPDFVQWQRGYSAFTHAHKDKDRMIEFVKDQKKHHQQVRFLDELKKLYDEAGIKFERKHLL